MPSDHDLRYKKLFADPEMLRQLLASFVDEDFVNELDFSTLKQLDKSFVSQSHKKREADLIFEVKFNGSPVYIFLLLEFQSTIDRHMALRFLRYICEFYQSLGKKTKLKCLPPVFPLLLYNGERRWTAAVNFRDMVQPAIPGQYIPDFSYYLIPINSYSKEQLMQIRNTVSAVFFTENSSYESLKKEIEKLYTLIKEEHQDQIRLFASWFTNYFGNVLEAEEVFIKLENEKEVPVMLARSLKETRARFIEEGKEIGREEGLAKGINYLRTEYVLRLRQKGFNPEQIADMLDLPLTVVRKLTEAVPDSD